MIHLVNYADERMTISQKLCSESSLKYGVENIQSLCPECIAGDFKGFNPVLNEERGAGYWLWKPYIIDMVMRYKCKDGDILIYSDAGVEWIENVNEIINRMDQGIYFFCNGHQHIHWCKMDVLSSILNTDFAKIGWIINGEPASHQQVQASVIFFKVNQTTRDFVKEWLLWCQMPGFIDDSPSKLPNHPEFAEHRHDQAILTCLQIKYGYKLHWWADKKWYMGMRDRWPDASPPMFLHHRKRNNEY